MRSTNPTTPYWRYLSKAIALVMLLAVVMGFMPFTLPSAQAVGESQVPAGGLQPLNTSQVQSAVQGGNDIGCLSGAGGVGNTFAVCVSNIVYYIMVGVFSTIAYVCAFFFDLAVQLSLNSTTYALNFITTSWEIVRDLANMSFIFILVWIALTIMLTAETTNTIKTLALVIIVALLVNFSFFFTRVAIDTGNLLALQFYNAIDAPAIGETTTQQGVNAGNFASGFTSAASAGNVKDLTSSIMNGIQLQNILNNDSFRSYTASNQGINSAMYILITLSSIYIAVGIVFGLLAGSFLFAGVKFMLRIVGLWFVIIASPLAFVAAALGGAGIAKGLFKRWYMYLFEFSIYPAVFLFMFFILTRFMAELNKGGSFINGLFALGSAGSDSNTLVVILSAIANVAVRLGFIIAMMYIALSAADKLSKTWNGTAKSTAGWLGNAIAGGGLGWVGRQTLGRFGRYANKPLLANSTYDPRNLRLARYSGVTPLLNAYKPTTDKASGLPVDFGKAMPPSEAKKIAADARKAYDEKEHAKEEEEKLKSAKVDAQRLGQINKEFDEKKLKSLEQEQKDYEQGGHLFENSKVQEIEKLRKLQDERDILAHRVSKYSNSQIASLAASDIQNIIKQISQEHVKAIQGSNNFSHHDKEHIAEAWHEQSPKAPMGEAKKQLDTLSSINKKLGDMSVKVGKLSEYTKAGAHVEVNLRGADEIKKEISKLVETHEDIRDNRSLSSDERLDAGRKIRELGKASKAVDSLIEKLKEVPEHIGEAAAPGAFKHEVPHK